ILDGHIVLDRAIAERGRYPAINILKSVSRAMPACNTAAEHALVQRARAQLATYEDMAELIRIRAYKTGTNQDVDRAVHYYPAIEGFLAQKKDESTNLEGGYANLHAIMDGEKAKGR